MNKLEDRLRTGLTAEAEAWQKPSLAIATAPTATKRGFAAVLIGAAAVLVLIGGVSLLARPAGDGQPPSAGNNGTPSTTMAISVAEPAPEWGALVDESLALIGWTPGVSSAYVTSGASRDKKTLTAVVRSADNERLLLTASYESFADLEEAEAWPREAALDNGEVTLFGMLYSTTESGRPALFLVKPVGVISVQVEDATAAAGASAESLRTLILHLGSSVDADGLSDTAFGGPSFEAIPFSGETWQFYVAEDANPSRETYEGCYRFDRPGEMTEASGLGPSGCGDWARGDTDQYFVSLGPAIEIDGGVVFLVDLTSNPVAKVRIVGSGGDAIEVAPFRLPGSGKQFAVVELPHRSAPVTVEVLDEAGTVLDTSVPLDWSAEDPFVVPGGAGDALPLPASAELGAYPISDGELRRILGDTPFLSDSGYRIGRVDQESPVTAELGVVLYIEPGGDPWFCLMDYAIVDGIVAAGGALCTSTATQVTDVIHSSNMAISGSCGPIPKDSPTFLDGAWTLLSLWALPERLAGVDISLADGSAITIPVSSNGTAQVLWHDSVTITSVVYEGMTPSQADHASQLLPAAGIDCSPDDGRNG